jgi:hypothetical protein
MTAAAFKASYSDWRLVKTRSVVQIVFEVPLEQADAAYQVVGGMPNFGSEQWFAIAKLHPEAKEPEPVRELQTPPARARNPDKRLITQAGAACDDPVFQRYLLDHQMVVVMSEEQAERAVRLGCLVQSRKEFLLGTPAGDRWQEFYGKFLAWKAAA